MLFNSYVFILAFLPLTLLGYFLLGRLPERIQLNKVFLVLASFVFYGYNNPSYVPIIAGSILVNYALSQLMLSCGKKAVRLPLMLLGLSLNLGVLFYFKYHDFFAQNLNLAFGAHFSLYHLALPLGISFFTFQQLSYVIDSYRRTVPRYKILDYALFVTFFPQLVAGPIERSSRLLRQVTAEHRFDWERTRRGLLIMMLGFFEKVVIADRACMYVDAIYGSWIDASGAQIALATFVFAVQDLCDFAGYSHIAIGAAKVLGVDLMTNFRQPYFAHSVQNFWARWHISLSTWFRDYIYFPLGAGRGGKLKQARNLMIVYTVSGLWHGAALKYVAWGMLNGALQVVEGLLPPPKNKPRCPKLDLLLHIFWTDFLILITMLIFRAGSLSSALGMLRRIPTAWGAPGMESGFSAMQALCTGVCFVILFVIELIHEKRKSLTELTDRLPAAARGLLYLLAVLAIVVFGVWGPGYAAQAFIYFQF